MKKVMAAMLAGMMQDVEQVHREVLTVQVQTVHRHRKVQMENQH